MMCSCHHEYCGTTPSHIVCSSCPQRRVWAPNEVSYGTNEVPITTVRGGGVRSLNPSDLRLPSLTMAGQQHFAPGTYTLFNRKFGTVLSIDPSDRTQLIASQYVPKNTGQRWEFISVATGFVIRSLLSTEAAPLYLLFKDAMRDGQRLRAGPHPMVFDVHYRRTSFARISFSTDFCMDLDAHGSKRVRYQ
ncbi:hypothetical protein C8Q78DRAFT_1027720 [Trametes maxima]|nr:hypothetical protein C8Q78DRAFT_1027720 [Trametes maxima]